MTDLIQILNWRRLTSRLTTSGQPSEAQLADIRRLGVTCIVNLGPHEEPDALDDEAVAVAALGMTYIYVPVKFDSPTDQNFDDFKSALQLRPQTPIHVHCIYNARVSAFFYRYARTTAGAGVTVTDAFANMESIWRPGDDWAAFIQSPDAVGRSNRYAGIDY